MFDSVCVQAERAVRANVEDLSSITLLHTRFLGSSRVFFIRKGAQTMPIVVPRRLVEAERPRLDVLARIRLLALRRRVFFKVLNRVERALFYLATKVIVRVHSRVLADALNSIVEKLLNAMESTVSRQIKLVGVPLAEKISRIAQKWGNVNASEWADDRGFIQYLAVTWVDHVFNNHTGDR